MKYIPSVMKFVTGFQILLRFFLGNLRGCNNGITNGEGFLTHAVEMSSSDMIYSTYQISRGSV
jgi:hypothetical protein